MATNGVIAYGTTLAGGTTGAVGEVISCQGGGRAANFATFLSCSSTNSAAEKKPTTIDEGEYTFEVYYDPTAAGVYNRLNTNYLAKTVETWTLTFPGAANTWVCSGFISSLGQPSFGGPDDGITVSLTITFSGPATYTDRA